MRVILTRRLMWINAALKGTSLEYPSSSYK